MGVGSIAGVKAAVRETDVAEAQRLAAEALGCVDAAAVRAMLASRT